MKCRRCKDGAIIELRRHNAAFCGPCFLRHCREQVRRAVEEFAMFEPSDRVLVAVSGGKDSLGLWDLLLDAGYQVDGLYLGLGIEGDGAYSSSSGAYARAFAASRRATLVEIDLPTAYGYDIPTGAAAAKRAPCSACGLSKRHLFNTAALDGAYDVVATGHNLDDEAAVLFGNTLRWNTEYLGRQLPVLPAGPGFVKKVKPLVRLGERELAAYCVLRGIDYIVEECPMADGNRHLGYKEALNRIEETSPGAKAAFYFEFLAKASPLFRPLAAAEHDGGLGSCSNCGAPTTASLSAFCSLVARATDPDRLAAVEVRMGRTRRRGGGARRATGVAVSREFAVGDRALLFDSKQRRYLVVLGEGGEFHTHAGFVRHEQLLGTPEGTVVRSTAGARYTAVRPTLADFVLKMPRGAQVIYPKDLGPILVLADVFPGARILESGVGSGALSMTLVRAGADVTGYELREDFAAKARANVAAFLGPEGEDRYRVELRDAYEGIDLVDLDRVVLDLPEPWRVVKHAEAALHPGGILVAYLPTIGQVAQLRAALDDSRFAMAETLEVLNRTWHVEGASVRPDHRMVAHTGFLTHARLLAD